MPLLLAANFGCSNRATLALELSLPWIVAHEDQEGTVKATLIQEPEAAYVELDDDRRVGIVSLGSGTFVDPLSAQALDLETITPGVSSEDDLPPVGSCGFCQWYRPEGVQFVFPGDRCPISPALPTQAYRVDGGDLVRDDSAQELLDQVRIEWPGTCECRDIIDAPSSIDFDILAPAVDGSPVFAAAAGDDGSLALASSKEVTIIDGDRRKSFPVGFPQAITAIPNTHPTRYLMQEDGGLSEYTIDSEAGLPVLDLRYAALLPRPPESRVLVAARVTSLFVNETVLYDCHGEPLICSIARPPDGCGFTTPAGFVDLDRVPWVVMRDGTTVFLSTSGDWVCGPKLEVDGPVQRVEALGPNVLVSCTEKTIAFHERSAFRILATHPLPQDWACQGVGVQGGAYGLVIGRLDGSETRTLFLGPGGTLDVRDGSRFGLDRDLANMAFARTSTVFVTFEGSAFADTGSGPHLIYGRDTPEPAEAIPVASRWDAFVAIRNNGQILEIQRDGAQSELGTIEDLQPGERVERVALDPVGTVFAITERENQRFVRGYDSAWNPLLAEPVPVELGSIEALGAPIEGHAFIHSDGRIFQFTFAKGLVPVSPTQLLVDSISTGNGMGWASGSGFVARFGTVAGSPVLDAYDLDALLPVKDARVRIQPLRGAGIYGRCGGQARVSALEFARNAAEALTFRYDLELSPDMNPSGLAADTALVGTAGDRPETDVYFLSDWVVMLEQHTLKSGDKGMRHPAPPVHQASVLPGPGLSDILMSGPFGRLTLVRPGMR